jgi:hypothetical protein
MSKENRCYKFHHDMQHHISTGMSEGDGLIIGCHFHNIDTTQGKITTSW